VDEVSPALEYNYTSFSLDVDMASFNGFRAGGPGAITEFIAAHRETNGEGAATMVGRASEQALKLIEASPWGTTNVNYPEYSLERDFGTNLYD